MNILEKASEKKIMVIGDFAVDRVIIGRMVSISREAPAPVIKKLKEDLYAGAAGNVAANISSMGAQVYPVGVVGNDDAGLFLRAHFLKNGNPQCLILDQERKTHVYEKIYCNVSHQQPQQIFRIDTDEKKPVPEKEILEFIKENLPKMHAVVVSDYEKGVVTDDILKEVSSLSKKHKIPAIGDSRNRINKFYDFTVLKPNDYETLCAATDIKLSDLEIENTIKDHKKLDDAAFLLIGNLNLEALLLTRGEYGITTYIRAHDNLIDVKEVPTKKVNVYDITGAGDSAGAAISLAISCNSSYEEAATLGNLAGGIAVSHWGTYAVTSQDLEKAIKEENV